MFRRAEAADTWYVQPLLASCLATYTLGTSRHSGYSTAEVTATAQNRHQSALYTEASCSCHAHLCMQQAGEHQQAVGQRALPMVDVGYDGEVPDLHAPQAVTGGAVQPLQSLPMHI